MIFLILKNDKKPKTSIVFIVVGLVKGKHAVIQSFGNVGVVRFYLSQIGVKVVGIIDIAGV